MREAPHVFDVLDGEATRTRQSAFGAVGELYSGEGIELVWVSKQDEEIDPAWFSAETVDLLLVLQGRLRVEFEDEFDEITLEPGQLLVLPAGTRCRAYRWPRQAAEATVFVAASPAPSE
jgi:hypothetical protein